MSFRDYSTTPSENTALGDGTYIGPNMLRNKVRPSLQQLAADGRELFDQVSQITAGPAGPSNNTRLSLAALKAAATTDKTSLYDSALWTWTLGDFTGKADDANIVKADGTDLTVGAWVRQKASAIAFGTRTVEDRLNETISVMDTRFAGGAKCDGITDDTAAVQAALDYCTAGTQAADPYSFANISAAGSAKMLLVPGPCRITSQLIIKNRKVDRTNSYFQVVGTGPRAGFTIDGNFVLFAPDVASSTAPVAEFLWFKDVVFWNANVANTAVCFDPRWLRMRFESCTWWGMRCLNSDRYAQEWTFSKCMVRTSPGTWFKAKGAYVVRSNLGKFQNNGGPIFDLFDEGGLSGVVGCSFESDVVESNFGCFLRAGRIQGLQVGGMYTEANNTLILDFRTLTPHVNTGISVSGCEFNAKAENIANADFYNILWGPGGGASTGNVSTGGLHDNAYRILASSPATVAGCGVHELKSSADANTTGKMFAVELNAQLDIIPDPASGYAAKISARYALINPVNGVESHTVALPQPFKGMVYAVVNKIAPTFTILPSWSADGSKFRNGMANAGTVFPANGGKTYICFETGIWDVI